MKTNVAMLGMMCLLTVRNTDASSRMTEYTSPLLFMETCEGKQPRTQPKVYALKVLSHTHR